jgi:hypothetical protein
MAQDPANQPGAQIINPSRNGVEPTAFAVVEKSPRAGLAPVPRSRGQLARPRMSSGKPYPTRCVSGRSVDGSTSRRPTNSFVSTVPELRHQFQRCFCVRIADSKALQDWR